MRGTNTTELLDVGEAIIVPQKKKMDVNMEQIDKKFMTYTDSNVSVTENTSQESPLINKSEKRMLHNVPSSKWETQRVNVSKTLDYNRPADNDGERAGLPSPQRLSASAGNMADMMISHAAKEKQGLTNGHVAEDPPGVR